MKFKGLFCLLIFNYSFSQITFLDINLENVQTNWNIKDAYLIKDETSKEYVAILEEDKVTYGFKFNEYKNLTKQIVSEGLKRKYQQIVGHVIQDNQVLLIQKNNKGNKFAYIKYDFDTQQTEEVEYEIEDRSDRFVESFVAKNKCLLFTVNNYDGKLKKWEFFIDGTFKVDYVDMPLLFSNAGVEYKPMDFFLLDSQGFSVSTNLVKVNNEIPNNLEIATQENKMYEHKDGFTWTFDHYLEYSLVFSFNYPDYNPVLKVIDKPRLEKSSGKSNSFIFEDKIAQIVSNNKELRLVIKSLAKPNKELKSIYLTQDDRIDFKNSAILQEGAAYSFGGTRKMEKTSKLLRKMSSDKNGISVYSTNQNYHITIGGTRPQNNGGAPMMTPGFTGSPAGQTGVMTVSYNPTFYAYGVYSSTGSTRIECLFDRNFKHLAGQIPENIFDRLDSYKESIRGLRTENITYLDGKLIFGYWLPYESRYIYKIID